jgi:hypothetical protein
MHGKDAGRRFIGWGVFSTDPWHFVDLFGSRRQAYAKAREMGKGYIVRFGELEEGTDSFVWPAPIKAYI